MRIWKNIGSICGEALDDLTLIKLLYICGAIAVGTVLLSSVLSNVI